MKFKTHTSGLTLVELMATIGIIAILMSLGVPAYRYVTTSNRMAAEVNGLLGDLQLARADAVKRGQSVTVCVSSNGTSCTGGTSWDQGWIVFADIDSDATVDTGEPVLRVQKTFTGTDTLVASNSLTAVTFNREAIAIGIASNSLLKLKDTPSHAQWTRCLSVTRVGLAWVQMSGTTVNGVTCS